MNQTRRGKGAAGAVAMLGSGTIGVGVVLLVLSLTSGRPALGIGPACDPPSCDDGNPCTDDVCVQGTCTNPNNDSNSCDDSQHCNGTDTCSGGECIHSGSPCPGPDGDDDCAETCVELPPSGYSCTGNDLDGSACDDGNDCTDDACASGSCVGTNDNSNTCDDDNPCTDDHCVAGMCIGDDNDLNLCSDGNLCTDDACVDGDCVSTNNNSNNCDDGQYCNGAETCNDGVCDHAGNPCPGPDGDDDCSESCDESADNCTLDDPDDSPCVDGVYCNGNDTCSAGSCSVHAGNPCPGPDGDDDCAETCDESADNCTMNDPDESSCEVEGESGECCSGGCSVCTVSMTII